MRTNGIPTEDLAALELAWTESQQTRFAGAGAMYWWPGTADMLDRWQAESEAIWRRDIDQYRKDAVIAEQILHRALAPETFVQRKARLDALVEASTPLDFRNLQDDWTIEARLAPIDRRIALVTGAVAAQAEQAARLGIRSDPAADVLQRAAAYVDLAPQARMARAEFLTRNLLTTQADLQGRIDAATITQRDVQHAADEIWAAGTYGIDVSSYQARIANDRGLFANALTMAEFKSISVDAKQIAADADHTIYVVMSQTHSVLRVPILMYHYIRVNPDPQDRLGYALSVTPSDFAAQMQWLAQNGYHPVTFRELYGYLDGSSGLPSRPIILTFDDGYADFSTTALPILVKYHFKAVSYVVSGFVGRSGYMTAAQVQAADRAGIEIASHTVDHVDLTRQSPEGIRYQLASSKQALEQLLGHPVLSFCYPYGKINAGVAAAVEAAGYRSATTTQWGSARTLAGRYTWGRLRINGGEGLARFAADMQAVS